MSFDYDVVIIGSAFSGAATALVLKRKRTEARVLIIEKTAEFDRKVGESTTEVSSSYMTRILGLTRYLGHHQLAKQSADGRLATTEKETRAGSNYMTDSFRTFAFANRLGAACCRWKWELINLALMLRGRAAMPANQASATVPTEAW